MSIDIITEHHSMNTSESYKAFKKNPSNAGVWTKTRIEDHLFGTGNRSDVGSQFFDQFLHFLPYKIY